MEPPGMEAPSTCTSWLSLWNALSRFGRLLGVLAAVYLWSRGAGAADSYYPSYRYELVQSADDKVCRHMLKVYNGRFQRPWDWPAEERGDFKEALRNDRDMVKVYSSLYPRSPEYDAIQWRVLHYNDEGKSWPFIAAEFDIDNDGHRETVMKSAIFYNRGDSYEQLKVFREGELDPSNLARPGLGAMELHIGKDGARPEFTPLAAIVRAFILDGVTYLSAYDHRRYEPPSVASPFLPPETLKVLKYLRGMKYLPEFRPAQTETVCEFNMVRTEK